MDRPLLLLQVNAPMVVWSAGGDASPPTRTEGVKGQGAAFLFEPFFS